MTLVPSVGGGLEGWSSINPPRRHDIVGIPGVGIGGLNPTFSSYTSPPATITKTSLCSGSLMTLDMHNCAPGSSPAQRRDRAHQASGASAEVEDECNRDVTTESVRDWAE